MWLDCCLKALYPERVFLLRGNHEFREQNAAMGISGFVCEVQTRFAALPSVPRGSSSSRRGGSAAAAAGAAAGGTGGGGGSNSGSDCGEEASTSATAEPAATASSTDDAASGPSVSEAPRERPGWVNVFEVVHRAFDWLPLAALLGGTALVLHGGIGDGDWGLEQLAHEVKRPLSTLRGAPLFVAQALCARRGSRRQARIEDEQKTSEDRRQAEDKRGSKTSRRQARVEQKPPTGSVSRISHRSVP